MKTDKKGILSPSRITRTRSGKNLVFSHPDKIGTLKSCLSIILVLIFAGSFGCKRSESTTPADTQKTISFTPSGTPSDNSVYLEQVSTNNDEITLALKIKSGVDIFSAAPEIDYDGNKIKYVPDSGTEGTFLNQGGVTTSFEAELEEDSNEILLIGLSRQSGVSGVDGDGILCQVVLKAQETQTDTEIALHITHSALRSSMGDIITGTSWLGGSLSYQ